MNEIKPWLEAAGIAQLGVALLNLGLVRLLRWKDELAKLPLLTQEVFQVHVWFISMTVAIFGIMTLRFAESMSARLDPVVAWLAAAIAVFWAVRMVIQVAYYSASHWRGNTERTVIHIGFLMLYGGMAVLYGIAAWGA